MLWKLFDKQKPQKLFLLLLEKDLTNGIKVEWNIHSKSTIPLYVHLLPSYVINNLILNFRNQKEKVKEREREREERKRCQTTLWQEKRIFESNKKLNEIKFTCINVILVTVVDVELYLWKGREKKKKLFIFKQNQWKRKTDKIFWIKLPTGKKEERKKIVFFKCLKFDWSDWLVHLCAPQSSSFTISPTLVYNGSILILESLWSKVERNNNNRTHRKRKKKESQKKQL